MNSYMQSRVGCALCLAKMLGKSSANLIQPVAGTSNGLTWEINDDGTMHVFGTIGTASWTYVTSGFITLSDIGVAAGDTMTVYGTPYIAIEWYGNGASRISYTASRGTFVSATIPEGATRCRPLYYATAALPTAGDEIDLVSMVMLAKGTVNSFEPYSTKGGLDKNAFLRWWLHVARRRQEV